jgi:ElaB/YqjD/DUF883 family membrane-anchored ribosome-binding protein
MFQPRPSAFDRRLSSIADQLRAIETELGAIGRKTGRDVSTQASAAGDQIAEILAPILSDIGRRFRRGRRAAMDEATSLGNEAIRVGANVGNDALERIAGQARQKPLFTLAVAIGVGILIGFATRRD